MPTVTATAPTQIGGAQVTVTDAQGAFAFPALTPGFFSVTVELDSFVTQEMTEVQVRLDRVTEIQVQLTSGQFEDQVVVTAEAAVIDPEQVSTGQTFTEQYLQKASVGNASRSYQAALGQAAGVVSGGGNPNVFGSTVGENAWYVDGLNTTDPVTSTFSGNYSFDIIQEISFQTGGYEAEFGNATGGVVNVITKSGGNDFSGTLDFRYVDDSFFEEGEFFDPDEQPTKTEDPSLTIGGPIVRDKFWFFLGLNRPETERTPAGSPTTRVFAGDIWFSKFSWQLDPSWRVVLKANGDPTDIDNANAGAFRPPETTRKQEQGGDIYQLDLAGVLNANALWDVRVGLSRRELNSFPMSGDLETPGEQNITTGQFGVNFGNAQFSDRDRDFLSSSLTWFVDEANGSHEFKGGVEYNDTYFESQNYTTGDYFFTRRFVGDNLANADIYRSFTNNPNRQINAFEGINLSLYAQDSWSISDSLTMKLGVRYDEASFDDNLGQEVTSLDKVQPRIGFAWDVSGDGKTIARASWGTFMHPSALTSASFAERVGNVAPTTVAFSCNYIRQVTFGLPADAPFGCPVLAGALGLSEIVGDPFGYDPEGWIVVQRTGAGVANQVSDDLTATYQDTLILGVERQVAKRTSVELSYINKETSDIFEDTCNGNFPTPSAGSDCSFYFMYNIPGLTREYEGVILRLESRAFDWLHLASSLTWSESKGNIQYTQNAGIAFDIFPDHFDNTFGYLDDHRDWRFKVNGYVDLPYNFILGFDGFWSSDSRWSVFEPASIYGDTFVEPRGSRKGNSNYQLDLQLTKSFQISDVRLQLVGAVINALDSERPIDRCEDLAGCVTVQGNAADLLDPVNWQNPRRYELGVRLEF